MRGQQGRLATGGAAWGVGLVDGVDGEAKHGVFRLAPLVCVSALLSSARPLPTHHDALRQVRLGQDDGAQRLEHGHEDGVGVGWSKGAADVADGRVVALDVELVLERDGHAVQRTDGRAMGGQMAVQLDGTLERVGKEDLGQTGFAVGSAWKQASVQGEL